jgi:tRNA 2-thiouridine synthesizing protein E
MKTTTEAHAAEAQDVSAKRFPHAPANWSRQYAEVVARAEGLTLLDAHWEVVRALQEYFARHDYQVHNMREVHDALDERFHARGGMKYLYQLFPAGPLAQGCRIAGLPVPFLAIDRGFGSVM